MIFFPVMRRRPRTVPSNIQRQTHGCTESTFVIFEDLRAREISHDFLVRGSGRASFAHYAVPSGISNHVCRLHRHADAKMGNLSATVVRMKSPHEGGVDESLSSKIRGPLSARNAQMPERRTAVFCNFVLR
jgi:hypothetical protein